MKRVIPGAALIFALLAFWARATGSDQEGSEVFLKLQEGWKARSDKVARADIRWDWTETLCKETIGLFSPSKDRRPTKDITTVGKCRAVIDGTKIRYEYTGQGWSYTECQVKDRSFVAVFDGSRYSQTEIKSPDLPHAQVTISETQSAGEFRHVGQQPLWQSLRWPFLTQLLPKMLAFEATGATVSIRGHPCMELSRFDAQTGLLTSIYVDPSLDKQIVRETTTRGESVENSMEISYQENDALNWVPNSWDYVRRNYKGLVLVSGHCTLTRIIVNPDLESSVFEPVLPQGARVIEVHGREQTQYGINEDGSKGRPIEATNRIIEYDDLFGRPAERRWLRYGIIASLLTIASVALAAYRYRRWHRQRGSNAASTNL